MANCYYTASLLAIAWATPFRIAHMTRATGVSQPEFNDLIHFYKPDSAGGLDKDIQVTESVPLNAWGDFIYCRSSEAGETWPAIYEKACEAEDRNRDGHAGYHADGVGRLRVGDGAAERR